jgi:hypothetical protein
MRFSRHPAFYLIGSNLLLWGVPLAIIQVQSTSHDHRSPAENAEIFKDVDNSVQLEEQIPVLASLDPLDPIRAHQDQGASSESAASPQHDSSPSLPVVGAFTVPDQAPSEQFQPHLMERLRGADGLGGTITLSSLREPQMPIAARAERLQQKQSGDPLAPLPKHWRDSLRQELASGPSVSATEMVRLPVPDLKEREELAVVVNERGEGNGLAAPRDQRVRAAVESWVSRQAPSLPGTVDVYVVAAEPLPAVTP